MEIIEAIFRGEPDHDATRRMFDGLRRWVLSGHKADSKTPAQIRRQYGPTLNACLGLPANPERARIALRDAMLRLAAGELAQETGNHPWRLAFALHREAQKFAGHRWHCWIDMERPPDHATRLEARLWLAMKAGGGKLPGTPRRMAQILSGG